MINIYNVLNIIFLRFILNSSNPLPFCETLVLKFRHFARPQTVSGIFHGTTLKTRNPLCHAGAGFAF